MAEEAAFSIELRGLDQLIKALSQKPPTIRIGVLGNDARRGTRNKSVTNATVGAVHEFGAPARNIPQRSFLRVPLSENLGTEIEKAGLLDKETLEAVIRRGSMVPWLEKVAVSAEAVVDDAFESSGNGQWPAWKDPNYKNEGGMLLVDSGQLRDAITSEVVE